jgi:hypothetical protein
LLLFVMPVTFMNLWFLTKEWTGLLEGCFIFACCVGKVDSCGTTYKNENLDLSMWVLRRNSINFLVELYSLSLGKETDLEKIYYGMSQRDERYIWQDSRNCSFPKTKKMPTNH